MSSSENKPGFDPVRFKEQERSGFNLVADRYEDAMSDTGPVVAHLVQLAALEPGQSVLDVATGPGLVARQLAQVVGARGQVVGVDIAEGALEVARQKAATANLGGLTFQVEDAENLSFGDGSFDRVVCSMGLMHFPDAGKALREMQRVLRPGGRLAASVWGEGVDAPFIQVALNTLSRVFPPPKVERPSMFRFGQPDTLRQLVSEAGFREVNTERAIIAVTVGSPQEYWKRFLGAAGITAVALAKQPPEVLQQLEKEVVTDLSPYRQSQGNGYDLSSVIMLVTGVK